MNREEGGGEEGGRESGSDEPAASRGVGALRDARSDEGET